MRKSNLQIRITPEIDSQIKELAPRSKSDFVRSAIEEKIRREKFKKLEEQWIVALKKYPEDKKIAEEWLKAEGWGKP